MDTLPVKLLAETEQLQKKEENSKSEGVDDKKSPGCDLQEQSSNDLSKISEHPNETLFELDDVGNPYLRRPEVASSPAIKDPKVSAKYQWRAGSVIPEDPESSESDEDFNDEFNKILSNKIHRVITEEAEELQIFPKIKTEYEKLDKSYYEMPDLSTLSLTCFDSLRIEVFGTVFQHYDALVLIKPKAGMYFLDVDTILFDENKHPVGRVYELMGLVESPFHNILFSSAQEAEKTLPLGMTVYFAPEGPDDVTNIFIPSDLEKRWRRSYKPTEQSDTESEADDPEQAAYFAKIRKELAEYEGRKRQKRGRQDSTVSNQSFVPMQKRHQRAGQHNFPPYAVPGMAQTFVSNYPSNPFALPPNAYPHQFPPITGQLYNFPVAPNVPVSFVFPPNPPFNQGFPFQPPPPPPN